MWPTPTSSRGGPRDAGHDQDSIPAEAEADGAADANLVESGFEDSSEVAMDGSDAGADSSEDAPAESEPVVDACSAEICNGVDDDCDGKVDEGCPEGLVLQSGVDGPWLGMSRAATRAEDDCGVGEVLVGLNARVGAFLGQVAGACANLAQGRQERRALPVRRCSGYQALPPLAR